MAGRDKMWANRQKSGIEFLCKNSEADLGDCLVKVISLDKIVAALIFMTLVICGQFVTGPQKECMAQSVVQLQFSS